MPFTLWTSECEPARRSAAAISESASSPRSLDSSASARRLLGDPIVGRALDQQPNAFKAAGASPPAAAEAHERRTSTRSGASSKARETLRRGPDSPDSCSKRAALSRASTLARVECDRAIERRQSGIRMSRAQQRHTKAVMGLPRNPARTRSPRRRRAARLRDGRAGRERTQARICARAPGCAWTQRLSLSTATS